MIVTMYKDCLIHTGLFTEEDCLTKGNLVDVDVPEEILRPYYEECVAADYDYMPFEQWLREESVADDMDGLFEETSWRPEAKDVVDYEWR